MKKGWLNKTDRGNQIYTASWGQTHECNGVLFLCSRQCLCCLLFHEEVFFLHRGANCSSGLPLSLAEGDQGKC